MRPARQSRQWLFSMLPGLVAFALYASTVGYGFVWDDRVIVERQIPAFTGWREILFTPPHLEFVSTYYRPLIMASYCLDNWLGDGAPWAFHLTTVLAHAGVSVLVFHLGISLGLGEMAALFAATLFAVHPIHTESVAWMAGRSDVLAAFFLVASLLALLRLHGLLNAVLGSLFLFCAVMTKEVAAISALLLPAAALLLAGTSPARATAMVVAAIVPYAVLRSASGAFSPGSGLAANGLERLTGLIGYYTLGLIVPLRPNALVEELRPWWLYALVSVVAVFALVAYVARGTSRTTQFLLLWIVVTSIPALLPALVNAPSAAFAERYLYLPSVGFCLLVADAAARWAAAPGRRRLAWVAGSGILLAGVLLTTSRQRIWADDASFWSAAVESNPHSWRAWRELATVHLGAGRLEEAEAAFLRALPDTPRSERPILLNNLGIVYQQTGRLAAAETSFREAAEINPRYADPLYNLGLQCWSRALRLESEGEGNAAAAQLDEARRYFEAALAIDPDLATAHYGLGMLSPEMERQRSHLEATIRLAPTSKEAAAAWARLEQLSPR